VNSPAKWWQVNGERRKEVELVKLNWWRISVKAAFAAVLIWVMSVFERLIHPVTSAQSAVSQLADTVESSAQMAAYSWMFSAGWLAVAIIIGTLVFTEALAVARANKEGDDAQ
jgi:cobalamin biosynthesis protein CobD/CbiB